MCYQKYSMGMRIFEKLSFLQNILQVAEILLDCWKFLPNFRFNAYSDNKNDITFPEITSS